jgi:hypothetical protein
VQPLVKAELAEAEVVLQQLPAELHKVALQTQAVVAVVQLDQETDLIQVLAQLLLQAVAARELL